MAMPPPVERLSAALLDEDFEAALAEAKRIAVSQTNTVNRCLHAWACDCAEHVQYRFQARSPGNSHGQNAIRFARHQLKKKNIAWWNVVAKAAEPTFDDVTEALLWTGSTGDGSAGYAVSAAVLSGIHSKEGVMSPSSAVIVAVEALKSIRGLQCTQSCVAGGDMSKCLPECMAARKSEREWQAEALGGYF